MTAEAGLPERAGHQLDEAQPEPEEAPSAGARPAVSDRLPRAWLFPLLVFAATWVLIAATWRVSDLIYRHGHPWAWHFIFKDAQYYLGIARGGYAKTSPFPWRGGTRIGRRTAFFPLFPLLIRLAGYLTGGNFLVAGLLVSVLAGAASALGVWVLAARLCGRRVADHAVLLYCLFPGAMTFGLLYSEPLSVAISAAALLAVLSRRWLLAGILGALGTAERPTLVMLGVVFAVAAVQAIWTRREWRALVAPALTPLGILAFFAYLGRRYHDYAFWFRAERDGWHQHIDWGAHTLGIVSWVDQLPASYRVVHIVLTAMFAAAVAGACLLIAARLPLPVTLFGLLMLALPLVSDGQGAKPRFIWAAFPIFIGAAAKLPRALYWPVLVLSAAGLVFLIGWWPHHYYGPAP